MSHLKYLLPFTVFVTSLPVSACTNFLVTAGASTDGSTIVTYAADAHVLYGELYHTPGRTHLPGDMLDVYEWDTGKYLGEIKQVPQTYTVVGNMNEHQVAVGETTFGGRNELRDPKGIMDYGSLIYIGLQRARTAREMIKVMTELVAEYGYYSSGESMSIADPNEVWLMEIIGKGPENKGAVWVARKIPDGYISGHANSPRIRQFPLNDSDTLYSPDVISFAREQGYFDGPDESFSFADVYSPVDFGSVRFCDSRVWCMYKRAAPSQDFPVDWVKGEDGAEPLPLWIKPDRKLSVRDVMELMRDHFEGTDLDMTADIGAGPYQLPYRWRPLTWKVGEQKYLNERATSTQQTGFSFVSQSRAWLPNEIGGVLWFGVDDTYSTVYVPMYCAISDVPNSFAVGTGDFSKFSWDSAFWTFNFVSNYTYLRYRDMIKDVQRLQRQLEGRFFADQAGVEAAALALYDKSPSMAIDYLTDYSMKQGDNVTARWRELGEHLIWKYLDGNVKDELGKVTHPGYPKEWYELVAKATGDHLAVRELGSEETVETINQEASDLAAAVLSLLSARDIEVDATLKQKIGATDDVETLKGWLIKSASVKSAADLNVPH
ncbi:MAG: dipeptidase [Phycisphaerae bacterium]